MRPILRTGLLPHTNVPTGQRMPSSRDIPPVTLSNIPPVDNVAFRTYLQQAGALYDALQRAKDGTDSDRPRSKGRSVRQDTSRNEPFVPRPQRRSSSQSITTLTDSTAASPAESAHFRRRSSAGAGRKGVLAVAPLSTIPSVYFEEAFRLENPRTFDVVSERAEIARPPPGAAPAGGGTANGSAVTPGGAGGKKALAANAILQEKLSWYMDTVEIHLIAAISTASASFFAALGALRELHAEAAASVARLRALRADLQAVDAGLAAGGLRVLALRRRRANLRRLGRAVEQLARVVRLVAQCEARVDEGAVEQALQGLADVEALMAGELPRSLPPPSSPDEPPPLDKADLIDLRGLKALEGAQGDISFLRKRIGKAFEARFIETLLGDLKRHINGVPERATFQRWDKASSRLRGQHVRTPSELPAYMGIDGAFRATLLAQLKGLARSDALTAAAVTYREATLREIKRMIQRHLPSASDDDAESTTSIATHASRGGSSQEKSAVLKRNVRALEPAEAEAMFKKVYASVGEALRRLGTQVKVILDITSSLSSPSLGVSVRSPPLRSPSSAGRDGWLPAEPSPGPAPVVRQEEIQQALDLSSLLGQAVDIAQAHIVKLLRVRGEQTVALPAPRFLRYFALNRLFADECEAVSGRGGVALKSVVQEHIRLYVAQAAQAETQRLLAHMDADRWDAKDFDDDDAARLERILASSTRDVEAWTRDALIWESDGDADADNAIAPPLPQRTSSALTNGAGAGDATATAAATAGAAKLKTRSAAVDGERFLLPGSATAALAGIEAFARLQTGMPNLTPDLGAALLDYVRQFRSRCSQLVLGAGATRSAGLKNITTKHLAVASQAISFVAALVPYLREAARRQMQPGGGAAAAAGLLAEFDKVKRLLQEQQVGLQDKFVEIMAGRAAAHVAALGKIPWDAAPGSGGVEGEAASGYMETLVKETTTLHKVLARYLPEGSVRAIVAPVLANYREQLGPAFEGAAVATAAGKARLLRDAEYFKTRMDQVEGARALGEYLCKIADGKAEQSEASAKSSSDGSVSQDSQSSVRDSGGKSDSQ